MKYTFLRAPRQVGFEMFRPVAWYWTGSPSEDLIRFLAQFNRRTVWNADPRRFDVLFAGKRRLGPKRARINQESLLLWLSKPKTGAWLALKPRAGQRAVLINPLDARVLKTVVVDPYRPTRVRIPWMAPLLLVVAPEDRFPPGLLGGD